MCVLLIEGDKCNVNRGITHAIDISPSPFSGHFASARIVELRRAPLGFDKHANRITGATDHRYRNTQGDRHRVIAGKGIAATTKYTRIGRARSNRSFEPAKCGNVEKEGIVCESREKHHTGLRFGSDY